jgi:hypothetical protein
MKNTEAKRRGKHESKPILGLPERQESIAREAYCMAAARGFASGQELDDWLQAEAEFDARARQQEKPQS